MKYFISLLIIFAANTSDAYLVIKKPFKRRAVFTTSTSWTVPAGATKISVHAWGAGGGSGGCAYGSVGANGNTGGASSVTGLLSAPGGGGGYGANAQYCTGSSGGSGGSCASTNDYECANGQTGAFKQWTGVGCTHNEIPGGIPVDAIASPWGMGISGAGQGGNASTQVYNYVYGGGGSGAYVTGVFVVTPGNSLTITVGTGGTAGADTSGGYCPARQNGSNGKIVIFY